MNAESLEETFVERCLSFDSPHTSGQTNYALAKLAARDLCKITAYLEKNRLYSHKNVGTIL